MAKGSHASCVPAATIATPTRKGTAETHVGVISDSSVLTRAQRKALNRALTRIAPNSRGPIILHHGCGHGTDEYAHRFARQRGNWRVHGHPLHKVSQHQSHQQTTVTRELDGIASGKPRRQRDADIVNASDIVVAVLTYAQPAVWKLLQAATLAGRKVIYIRVAQPLSNPETSKKIPVQRSSPAGLSTAAEKIAWARWQGTADRSQGRTCPDYRVFCAKFGIPGSALAQQMWSAYTRPIQKGNPRADQAAVPRQRLAAAVSASSLQAPARPVKRSAAESTAKQTGLDRRGIPVDWYEIAVSNLGTHADVIDDGSAVRLVLKSGGKVLAEVPMPRGAGSAASFATAFNREVAKRKMNPPLTDAWR